MTEETRQSVIKLSDSVLCVSDTLVSQSIQQSFKEQAAGATERKMTVFIHTSITKPDR
jgi:hypothetical protein